MLHETHQQDFEHVWELVRILVIDCNISNICPGYPRNYTLTYSGGAPVYYYVGNGYDSSSQNVTFDMPAYTTNNPINTSTPYAVVRAMGLAGDPEAVTNQLVTPLVTAPVFNISLSKYVMLTTDIIT